jgi:exosortase/archaeosortase
MPGKANIELSFFMIIAFLFPMFTKLNIWAIFDGKKVIWFINQINDKCFLDHKYYFHANSKSVYIFENCCFKLSDDEN